MTMDPESINKQQGEEYNWVVDYFALDEPTLMGQVWSMFAGGQSLEEVTKHLTGLGLKNTAPGARAMRSDSTQLEE